MPVPSHLKLVVVDDSTNESVIDGPLVSPPGGCYCLKVRDSTGGELIYAFLGGTAQDPWTQITVQSFYGMRFKPHSVNNTDVYTEGSDEAPTAIAHGRWVPEREWIAYYFRDAYSRLAGQLENN